MKDRSYFPFERNRYYYGKLLSVEDFQREQAYMNQKRYLLNRLLFGDGILCGMQVLQVDEESISIEMGAALDYMGREIIIDQPVIKRLSVIDGFVEHCVEEEGKPLYLCISYGEEAADPVYSIGAAYNAEGKQQEFNTWREGYHLFLTSEEPTVHAGLPEDGYQETRTIFYRSGLRISLSVPRFLEQNQDENIRILIDKSGDNEAISFQMEVELTGADWKGRNRCSLSFQEMDWEPADHYEVEYTLRAAAGETEGSLVLCPDSFVLEQGSYEQRYPIEGQFVFRVIAEKKEHAIWEAWRQSAMEEIWNASPQPLLYLAEINVIQAGDTYVIEQVRGVPYSQYIWNNRLLGMLKHMEIKEYAPRSFCSGENRERVLENPSSYGSSQDYTSGILELSLGLGGAAGQIFYSGEIIHGLGPGAVFLSVGAAGGKKRDKEIIYGSPGIFSGEPDILNVETGVKLYMNRGSFQVGVRCLEEIHEDRLTIYWFAVRTQKKEAAITDSLIMTVRPNMPRVCVRQSVMLEAFVGEERQTGIRWEVMDTEGGSIDSHGLYTAPNHTGIYEVRAQEQEGSLKAVVYVIVGEEE